MAKMKLVPSYRFDKYGYYIGPTVSMQDLTTGQIYLPHDCVAFAPPDTHGSWRIRQDRSAWDAVPEVDALEVSELVVGLEDTTKRGAKIKARMAQETKLNPELIRIIDRGNYLCYLQSTTEAQASASAGASTKSKKRRAPVATFPVQEIERRRAYAAALGL